MTPQRMQEIRFVEHHHLRRQTRTIPTPGQASSAIDSPCPCCDYSGTLAPVRGAGQLITEPALPPCLGRRRSPESRRACWRRQRQHVDHAVGTPHSSKAPCSGESAFADAELVAFHVSQRRPGMSQFILRCDNSGTPARRGAPLQPPHRPPPDRHVPVLASLALRDLGEEPNPGPLPEAWN